MINLRQLNIDSMDNSFNYSSRLILDYFKGISCEWDREDLADQIKALKSKEKVVYSVFKNIVPPNVLESIINNTLNLIKL